MDKDNINSLVFQAMTGKEFRYIRQQAGLTSTFVSGEAKRYIGKKIGASTIRTRETIKGEIPLTRDYNLLLYNLLPEDFFIFLRKEYKNLPKA